MAQSPLLQPSIQNQFIAQLLKQGMDTSPVGHPTQAFARMAQALMGGLESRRLEQEENQYPAEALRVAQGGAVPERQPGFISRLLGAGGQPQSPPPPTALQPGLGPITPGPRPASASPAAAARPDATVPIGTTMDQPPQQPMGQYGNAIAKIESGGRYDLLGPVTRTGDRAHGKYQVMGANIGPWSEAALGRRVTPQEFLASPEIQEKVFQHQFGQYVQRHGPEGAARAWFAGEGGMNDPNRRDQLGTTVQAYANKFNAGVGQPPMQVAQAQTPHQGGPPMAPGPQGQPARPQVPAEIERMINSGNPRIAKDGLAMLRAWQTQQMAPPKFHKLNDEMLFDERTGRTQAAGPGFRPLTDPAERARFGIPADDKRPYQVGPGNKLINPPAENRITVDQRGENAFAQNAAAANAKRYNTLVEGGFEAQSMVADLGALRDIGKRITTGKTAEVTAALGPYAEAVGVKIDKLDDLQAYQSIVSRMAPRMRVAGSGATSDFEMRQFLQALPTLGNTPQGNEIITNTLDALQQHRMAAADIGSRALAGEITPREAEKELRALPNPLELWKKSRGQAPSANPGQTGGQTPGGQPTPQQIVDELRRRGLAK